MSSLPEPHIHSKNKIEVELDLFNYTTLVSTKDYNFFSLEECILQAKMDLKICMFIN